MGKSPNVSLRRYMGKSPNVSLRRYMGKSPNVSLRRYMGKSPNVSLRRYMGKSPNVSLRRYMGDDFTPVQLLNSNALVYMPIKWWPSSCQTRRRTQMFHLDALICLF
uniref:Uncharacterized protein n=1 Tax=Meloidogyne enterolobii TaxID=390850 RepID=A0A6V7XKP1_MELEN|nr:unnamed protein product [Meloidogyne enterolobii]